MNKNEGEKIFRIFFKFLAFIKFLVVIISLKSADQDLFARIYVSNGGNFNSNKLLNVGTAQ